MRDLICWGVLGALPITMLAAADPVPGRTQISFPMPTRPNRHPWPVYVEPTAVRTGWQLLSKDRVIG